MLTYMLWDDFKYKCKERYIGFADKYYKYDNSDIVLLFMVCTIVTPLVIISDLVLSPFEIIYLIALKVVNKLRKEPK